MSNAALTWAFYVPVLGSKKAVLIALANHADDRGSCWPSIARLTLFSGISERGVRLALRELEADHIITTERSGGRTASRYTLSFADDPSRWSKGHNAEQNAGLVKNNPEQNAGLTEAPDTSTRHSVPPNPAPSAATRHSVPSTRHSVPPKPQEPSRTVKGNPQVISREPGLLGSLASDDPPMPVDPPSPPPKPGRRAKARSQIDPEWWPDGAGQAFAAERSVDPDQEVPRFRDYHLSRGNLMADWAAAWRTWCQNQVRFQRQARSPPRASAGERAMRGFNYLLDRAGVGPAPPPHPGPEFDAQPGDWNHGET